MSSARAARRGLATVWIWTWVVVSLVPIVFMVVTSFKPAPLALAIPPVWRFHPTLANYREVLGGASTTSAPFGPLLLHSAIVSISATALTIALALPAAYALASRYLGPRRPISMWMLSTTMYPPIVAVIPVFVYAGKVGLIDTFIVLIVPYAAFNLPLAVWMIRSTVVQVPDELEQAALVDGASRFKAFLILLPLVAPGIAAAAILSLVLSWNEFLFALTLTRSHAATAPVGVLEFTGMYGTQWGALTAASTLIVAPVMVLALILRRRLISGLTFGAVKA